MQAVSLYDTLTLFKIDDDGIEVTTDAAWLTCGRENLVYKAAETFLRAAGIPGGVKIHLAKVIPAGGGLGGGSSDAAAVITGLNTLCSAGLTREALAGIGAGIGADVPFFVYGGTALCRGRGDLIAPVRPDRPLAYIIAVPPFGVATAEVYGRLRSRGQYPSQPREAAAMVRALTEGDSEALRKHLFNRLEEVVMNLDGRMRKFRDALYSAGGAAFTLTGSGASFFCPAGSVPEGRERMQTLQRCAALQEGRFFVVEAI